MLEYFSELYRDDYLISRFLIQRALGIIYLLAFVNALNQFAPLLGEKGLIPLPRHLNKMSFKERPSIFLIHYSDRFFEVVAWAGVFLSVVVVSGISERGPLWMSVLIWFLLWLLYLSIVNVGIVFYGFGWESMLLEAGFYAVFFGSVAWVTPVVVIVIIRWMLFRVEFGAGLIKMRGDACWRNFTCMHYHHETQPLPNPLSRYFHHLPVLFHKIETLGNHAIQLVVVWGLFLPQPVASISAALIILSQLYLVFSGNYSWLNWLTITLAFSGFSDDVLRSFFGWIPPEALPVPPYFQGITLLLAVTIAFLSIHPIKNMLSSHQRMNFSYNSFHLVNSYGAFGSVTKRRFEIIIEGTREEDLSEDTIWEAYEFKGKPGDPARRPPQVAPYHLRLDWQMWFAAMSAGYKNHGWFAPLIHKLLLNESRTLGLLKSNPFPDSPPVYIRARLFHYRYSDQKEKSETGNWWVREYVHSYMSPRKLDR